MFDAAVHCAVHAGAKKGVAKQWAGSIVAYSYGNKVMFCKSGTVFPQ